MLCLCGEIQSPTLSREAIIVTAQHKSGDEGDPKWIKKAPGFTRGLKEKELLILRYQRPCR